MKWGLWSSGLMCLMCLVACAAPATPQPRQALPTVAPTPAPVAPVQIQTTGGSAPLAVQSLRPVASPSPAALPLSVLAGRSGADVRVALNLMFQEQLYLSAAAVDAASSARLDELGAVSDTLDQNSLALAEVVGAVKGESAARALLDAWRGVAADLVQYAQGGQAAAGADLDQRRAVIATQLALDGLSRSTADDLVRARLQAQLSVADAIISHDATRTAQRLRVAAAASDRLAEPLAAAISARTPSAAPPPTAGLDIDVRIGLTRLLQEHTYLTGGAVAAAADNRGPDLHALVDAADQNATDMGTQLGSAYGQAVADSLSQHLVAETASLVSVASGGDRAQAAADLGRGRDELDGLLSSANQLLPPGLVGQELRATDQPLLTATDAFSARDFATAFTRLRESARQSQKAADSVALSLVDRYPGRYFVMPTPTVAVSRQPSAVSRQQSEITRAGGERPAASPYHVTGQADS